MGDRAWTNKQAEVVGNENGLHAVTHALALQHDLQCYADILGIVSGGPRLP